MRLTEKRYISDRQFFYFDIVQKKSLVIFYY